MTKVLFDYDHPRAKKIRFVTTAQKTIFKILWFTLMVITIFGAALAFGGGLALIAALAASLGVYTAMLGIWVQSESKNLDGRFDPNSDQLELHLALDGRVLGRLKQDASPQDIWQSIKGTWEQQFFATRFGLSSEVFDKILCEEHADSDKVWYLVTELAKRERQESISGATIMVALLLTIPGYQDWLARLHLEPNDIVAAIDWQRHIEDTIARSQEHHYDGGLARDWTAGFTPLLSRLGSNITHEVQSGGFLHRDLDSHRQSVDNMVQTMAKGGRPNVALIGEVGVGKTTTVYAFAQRLMTDKNVPKQLRFNQVIELKAPTLLAQVNDKQSLETLILKLIIEANKAKNTILFLDDAQMFLSQGTGSVDLSNVLLPVLERGSVPLILALTPNDWQGLIARNPSLTGMINYFTLTEPDEQNTLRILEDQVILLEYQHKVRFMFQSLREAYRLGGRYLHDGAFPGKAIRVLEMSVNKANGGLVTEQSIQQALEASLGVKVQAATGQERQSLLNLEDEIHKRMINQTRAVKVVADALRRARSGVNNPNRPIGTFLFLGPTGVGKTELSKALAEVYFSGADRIVRVDMNEYVQPQDAARLLDPGTETGTTLVAQIRKQPFSVVLFDEIEKAHPNVVNLLLQLLDEGVLRDSTNREVSFRDSIVIATSNAGADKIREQVQAGNSLEAFEEQFINDLIDSNLFKPEFLNRFDETVLFRPLDKPELMQVVDLMIAGINKTLMRQKVQVSLSQDAKAWLVDNGYDARLGARPLRRMVQRSVENIVAKKLLSEDFHPGTTLHLSGEDLASSQT